MFMFCRDDFSLLFDLTGPDGWQNNERFLQKMNELAAKKFISYASEHKMIDEENNALRFNPENFADEVAIAVNGDLDTDAAGVLIISNDRNNVRKYVEDGFSTVYLRTENCDLDVDLSFMPEAIWEYEDLYAFIDHPKTTSSYASEIIGFPNEKNVRPKFITLKNRLDIPNCDEKADVVFTGRYFTTSDSRHYIHPLSRAIIGFKNNYYNYPTVVKNMFGRLIDTYVNDDSTVSRIVFVPPRPNQTSRFIGIEKEVKANIPIEYDLLYAVTNYQSPKDTHDFSVKYDRIKGNIACKEEISGHILLVDDVYTSGATTAECAKALYDSGAEKVTILPLAFTQDFNYQDQLKLPAIFDDQGYEYKMGFRKNDYGVYWFTQDENRSFLQFKDYEFVQKQYIAPVGTLPIKKEFLIDEKIQFVDRVDAIIFDLDNTLLQTDHLERYRDERRAVKDKSLLTEKQIIIEPKTLSTLRTYGIKVGIVTRSPEAYAKSVLEAYNFPYDVLITRKDTFRTKPFPDPMLQCAKKLGVDPQYVITIGDEKVDQFAGENAGMMTLSIDEVLSDDILMKIIAWTPLPLDDLL